MDLLLIGRSGNGKSATGNNILGNECFTKNNDSYAKSSKPTSGSQLVEDQRVTVVDGLCLQEDHFKDCVGDAFQALRLGNDGFTALIFVLRYGEKFSADEINLVKLIKRVFGQDVVKDHVICVVTRGDDFKYAVEEGEETVRNIYEWGRKQTGDLGNLLRECRHRVVLFDNKTKDKNEKKRQVSQLLENVGDIQSGGVERYTVDSFSKIHGRMVVTDPETDSAEFERRTRDKIKEIRECGAAYLKDGIPDEKLQRALREEMRDLSKSVSQTLEGKEQKSKYIQEIQELCDRIKEKEPRGVDKGDAHVPPSVQTHLADKITQQHLDTGNGQKISLLLLGRTGNGKSSTGNSILGKPAFQPSASMSSATAEVVRDSATIDSLHVTVIDGPGLDDTEKTSEEDFLASLSSVEKALDLCDYGFSAIVVVLRFGNRFTRQESDAIRVMRSVLGKNVLRKYGVCLMTHGDNFDYEMTQNVEDGKAMSFQEWCEAQTGDIQQLFEECTFRCVLFDNKTKDPKKLSRQRQDLLAILPSGCCYSKQEFKDSERDLLELNFELILPKLEHKTNEKLEKFRDNLKTMERDCVSDDSEYFKKMESLLGEIADFKELIVALGENKETDFFILQLSTLESEVNTKIKLRAQSRDMKSPEGSTASQARPEWVSAPLGSAGQRDHGNAPWPSDIHDPQAPPWLASSYVPVASPYLAPRQGYGTPQLPQHGGSESALSISGPAGTYAAPGVLSWSEVSDVQKGTMLNLQEIYAEFLTAQERTDAESRKRGMLGALDKFFELKKTLHEIAKGSFCYEDVKSKMSEVENEMRFKLEQELSVRPGLVYRHHQNHPNLQSYPHSQSYQYPLSYPHSQSYQYPQSYPHSQSYQNPLSYPQGQATEEKFLMIENSSWCPSETYHRHHRGDVASRNYKPKEKKLGKKKRWSWIRNMMRYLKYELLN